MPLNPRKSALHILNQLDTRTKTLDTVLDTVFDKYPEAERRDKALVFAMVYGILRHRGHLDWVISHFSRTKINKIDPQILNILRIGLFQIIHLDRIPVSAAVNTSVEMAKTVSAPWVVKYVNGVLRNAARGFKTVPLPKKQKNPAKALAVSHSFPEWLIRRWIHRFGLDETQSLCSAFNQVPAITLRTNTLKTDRITLMETLCEGCSDIQPTDVSPEGILIHSPQTPISEMAAFKDGGFTVQDEAAQLVTHLLNPEPGETILDACCGLGGKTGHIGQFMKNKGKIIAIDKNGKKLSVLSEEMHRLGIHIVSPQREDLSLKIKAPPGTVFDRILLDAPCSGLGVIKRNPDTKWRMTPENFKPLNKTQTQLLHQCAELVKPGGIIVYVVCSMAPEENEKIIDLFLTHHTHFSVEKPHHLEPLQEKHLIDKDGFLRTYPHKHNMDGFFAVRLKKQV